jgi:hypothetical protein
MQATASREVDDYIARNRVNMGKFIHSPIPDDPDAQLLRVAACSLIFSATEEHFRLETPGKAKLITAAF